MPDRPMTAIQLQIIGQLYKAVERFTDDAELLSLIGSWGDTLSDAEILELLQEFNAYRPIISPIQ